MKKQFKGFYALSAVLLLIAVLLPVIVNQSFMILNIKSASDLGNKEWLGFCGSYLGGIIGAFATLIALFATYKQNELQHALTRQETREQNRLQVLPFIAMEWETMSSAVDVKLDKFVDLSDQDLKIHSYYSMTPIRLKLTDPEIIISNLVHIVFKNVGVGPAVNLKLGYLNRGTGAGALMNLMPQSTISIYFLFPKDGGKYNLVLQYNDVQARLYRQRITIEYDREEREFDEEISAKFKISDSDKPELINKS